MSNPTEACALVTATCGGTRYVLLIETDAGWATPGGTTEPDEHPGVAALRELQGKTGLNLYLAPPVIASLDEPRRMPEPDGAVTVVARCDLGEVDALPEVRGGDDHGCFAEWIPIALVLTGYSTVFPAHHEILSALR